MSREGKRGGRSGFEGSPRSATAASSPRRANRSRGGDVPPPEESDSGIRVLVRVRPFNQRETEEARGDAAVAREEGREPVPLSSVVEAEADCQTVCLLDHLAGFTDKHTFSFDYCFTPFQPRSITFDDQSDGSDSEEVRQGSQEAVFARTGLPALQSAWEGYNACVFAYGQTSSGKTYTMMGTKQEPGIIPRLCRALFERVEEVEEKVQAGDKKKSAKVTVTFMEIYNEQVKDLLRPPERGPKVYASRFDEKHIGAEYQTLRVRHHPLQGPFVEGITKKDCVSWAHCVQLIRLGTQARAHAATHMNEASSRSHAIFQLCVTQTEQLGAKLKGEPICSNRMSKLNLVDLAGSERLRKTDVKGKHMLEANHINKSLMTLRKVIDTLVANMTAGREHQRLPPYRESLLTWILADNFGGNAKTVMVANVSPYWKNSLETESTLRYATTAKGIVNRVRVNEDASAKLIRELQSQVRSLQEAKVRAEAAAADTQGERQRIRELEEEILLSNKAIDELRDREQDLEKMTERFKRAEEELVREREQWKARAEKLEGESQALRAALEEMTTSGGGRQSLPPQPLGSGSALKSKKAEHFWLDEAGQPAEAEEARRGSERRVSRRRPEVDDLPPRRHTDDLDRPRRRRRPSREGSTVHRRESLGSIERSAGAEPRRRRRSRDGEGSPKRERRGQPLTNSAELKPTPATSPPPPEFGRRAKRRDEGGAQSCPPPPRRRQTPPEPPPQRSGSMGSHSPGTPQSHPQPTPAQPTPTQSRSSPQPTAGPVQPPPAPATAGHSSSRPAAVRPRVHADTAPTQPRDALDDCMPPALPEMHRASAPTNQQMIAFTEIDDNKDAFDALFKSPSTALLRSRADGKASDGHGQYTPPPRSQGRAVTEPQPHSAPVQTAGPPAGDALDAFTSP
eukprot:TRINITY_DN10313_c0_g1_i1.p1 TRINITY_DN10313_c0_g1~~TRINITY_DN10313_c0_g1_i1.p1  ORF type:complete len:911 (+),score=225.87 TRINITY_DN10313_c0_g1_i1:82-2814(+)